MYHAERERLEPILWLGSTCITHTETFSVGNGSKHALQKQVSACSMACDHYYNRRRKLFNFGGLINHHPYLPIAAQLAIIRKTPLDSYLGEVS